MLKSHELGRQIDEVAATTAFAGVVHADLGRGEELLAAYGLANRAHERPNTAETQFAIASGTKGFTAVTVVSLIEDGVLDRSTTARSVLGRDLPLVRDEVTVEHLLAHRSGIGDYLDEDAHVDVDAYLMPVPVHELATTEQYLAVLDGHESKFAPGERFSYSNSGYVLLALIAERTTGVAFHELVRRRVCDAAGMPDTAFLRSDELPARAARGYLAGHAERTNVLHLPVCGSGDGGIYSSVADVHSFWRAFFAGELVSEEWVAEMTRPHSERPGKPHRYGLGFWLLDPNDAVTLEGSDAGVSFRSVNDRARATVHTVVSNTSDGAWPIAQLLRDLLR